MAVRVPLYRVLFRVKGLEVAGLTTQRACTIEVTGSGFRKVTGVPHPSGKRPLP